MNKCPNCNRGVKEDAKNCRHCDFGIAIWASAVKRI